MSTLAGITAILMWAALALLGMMASNVPRFELLALCFAISAVIPLLLPRKKQPPRPSRPNVWRHHLIGAGCLFLFHYCYFQALQLAPAVEVSLIGYLWPLFLSLLLATRATRLQSLIGSVTGFVGVVVLVSGKGAGSFSWQYMDGYLLAFACALIWAGYSRYLKSANSYPLDIAWQSAAVALLAFTVHITTEDFYLPQTSLEWIGVILLGLGPVGGAFYLWEAGMRGATASMIASCSFFTPVLSACLLVISGMNAWRSEILIALCLILTGSLIAQWRWRRAVPSPL